jgi:hypothetical protein
MISATLILFICACLFSTTATALQVKKKRASAFSAITIVAPQSGEWARLVIAYNASVPGFQQLCRKASIQFASASNSTVKDSCGQPYVFSNGASVAYFFVYNTSQPDGGDVTIPASLLVNNPYAPMLSYLVPSPSPWASIGFLGRSQSSFHLGQYSVGGYIVGTQVRFTFLSTADCNQFVGDIDTDCSLSHSCNVASPSVQVDSVPTVSSNNFGRCAIDNFADLSFSQGFAQDR